MSMNYRKRPPERFSASGLERWRRPLTRRPRHKCRSMRSKRHPSLSFPLLCSTCHRREAIEPVSTTGGKLSFQSCRKSLLVYLFGTLLEKDAIRISLSRNHWFLSSKKDNPDVPILPSEQSNRCIKRAKQAQVWSIFMYERDKSPSSDPIELTSLRRGSGSIARERSCNFPRAGADAIRRLVVRRSIQT
jgi:hypothetical protein